MAIAKSDGAKISDSIRSVELELVGDDQVGIVSSLTKILAEHNISIENMHTEIIRNGVSGKQTFKIGAHLLVPAKLSMDDLREELGALAHKMIVDVALGEKPLQETLI